MNLTQPTYYVRHPDDTYSIADPQPVLLGRAVYAQCDQKHTDSDCEDPYCHLHGKEVAP